MRQLPRRLLFLAALLPASLAGAQTATLVTDLQTVREPNPFHAPGSQPRQLLAAGGRVFFTNGEYGAGTEVWVTDGTAVGTQALADICPGTCSSNPRFFGSSGGVLFFAASDGQKVALWRSDGTRPGTFVLTPPGVGVAAGAEEEPGAFLGGSLFFIGCTHDAGCELWKSDGTAAGTGLVRDLVPGDEWSQLGGLTVAAGRLFFYARTSDSHDHALWVSDGTEAGTRVAQVLDDFYPGKLVAAGGKVFFTASTYPDGQELWVSDGTEAGTLKLTDFAPNFPIGMLKGIGGRLYFVADDVAHGNEIWRTDGTPAGTTRVTDFGFYRAVGGLGDSQLEEVGGRLVFVATDGISGFHLWTTSGTPQSTTELCTDCNVSGANLVAVGGRVVVMVLADQAWRAWSTDGTRAGTAALPAACTGVCNSSSLVTGAGAALFFGPGEQIWRTDGTAAGTRRFTDLPRDTEFPTGLTTLATIGGSGGSGGSGPRIYFPAEAGGFGEELWMSDGQPGGTRLVADLGQETPSSYPSDLVNLDERILFAACSGPDEADSSRGIWQSAGSAASTLRLTPPETFSFCSSSDGPEGLTRSDGQVFFWLSLGGSYEWELWRSDGTAAGTRQVTHLGDHPLYAPRLYPIRGQVFFLLPIRNSDGPDTVELWKSDGTPEGTGKAFDLPSEMEFISSLHALGDEIYFVTHSEASPLQIWRSDGTAAGTRQILAGSYSFEEPFRFARTASAVIFFAQAPNGTPTGRLWRTDGTAGGTSYVADLPHDAYERNVFSAPAVFQGAVYFFAKAGEDRHVLWRTDGTGLGTKAVKEFRLEPEPEPLHPVPEDLVVAGNRLFFRADDGVHGPELWQTDGTAEGTTLVSDIVPGPAGSQPSELGEGGGRLFFSAHDGVHGFELWQSNGTEAGTRLVQDIAPGPGSSSPQEMTASGGRLYFSADDGYTGRELWMLPLAGAAGCQPSADHLCLGGGRFQVEARWRDFHGNAGTGAAVGLTADTGYFWFFDAGNVEVVVKVLDGQGVNGHRWVFYGALSNVEYTFTVTDTQTGATVRYFNPPGQLASVGDTRAFGPLGAKSTKRATAAPQRLDLIAERTDPKAATGSCQESETRLCLNGDRFAVEASWKAQGQSGAGTAVRLTGDTGYFWFFGLDNVEVVLKVLDGRALNNKFWVFYGALSDVEYTLTVTDTQTGKVRTYANPAGRMASVADTSAF